MRRVLLCISAVLFLSGCDRSIVAPVVPASQEPPPPLPPAGLMTQVARGGYILFFRHTMRDANAISTAELARADNQGTCLPGSQLTEAGRADAAAIGQAFSRIHIVIDRVFASPTCRTQEMSSLAFGAFEVTRALTWPGMWIADENLSLTSSLRALLAAVPRPGSVIVLIGHNDVLQATRVGFDVTLNQGDAAVIRPVGNDSFELAGIIPRAEWLAANGARALLPP